MNKNIQNITVWHKILQQARSSKFMYTVETLFYKELLQFFQIISNLIAENPQVAYCIFRRKANKESKGENGQILRRKGRGPKTLNIITYNPNIFAF